MIIAEETLWGLEPGAETTALCWHKRQTGKVSQWDGRQPQEPTTSVLARHERARLQCHHCPLLNACERALSEMEKKGLRVDGVMAGRYSDVLDYSKAERDLTQTNCRGCQATMRPQGRIGNSRRLPEQTRQHAGEGLCEDCYPRLSRAARHPPPPPAKRSYQQNNPTGYTPT